jgi:hypothetical protein
MRRFGQVRGPRRERLEVFISRPSWRYLPTVAFGSSNSGPSQHPVLNKLSLWVGRDLGRHRRGARTSLIQRRTGLPLSSVGPGVISPPDPFQRATIWAASRATRNILDQQGLDKNSPCGVVGPLAVSLPLAKSILLLTLVSCARSSVDLRSNQEAVPCPGSAHRH